MVELTAAFFHGPILLRCKDHRMQRMRELEYVYKGMLIVHLKKNWIMVECDPEGDLK